jgi:hypothetical protein
LTEKDLVARDAFARSAAALRGNDPSAIDRFLEAAVSLIAEHAHQDEIWLVDSLLPGFLFLVGRYPRSRIARYRDELAHAFAPLAPRVVYLTGDPDVFLDRATERSGPTCEGGLVSALSQTPLPDYPGGAVRTGGDLRRFLRWADGEIRDLLAGWAGPTLVLNASSTPTARLRDTVLQSHERRQETSR